MRSSHRDSSKSRIVALHFTHNDQSSGRYKITTQPGAAPGYAKGRRRREEIILTAFEYFSEFGYHESSLREIASHIGVTHAGLLYHFETKEELLTATLERHSQLSDAIFSQHIIETEAAAGTIWNAIEAFVQVMQFKLENPGFVRLYNAQALQASQSDTVTFEFFNNRMNIRKAMHIRFFEALMAEGIVCDAKCPNMSADLLIAVIDGLHTQFLLAPDSAKYLAALHAYLRTAMRPEHWERLDETFQMTEHGVHVTG